MYVAVYVPSKTCMSLMYDLAKAMCKRLFAHNRLTSMVLNAKRFIERSLKKSIKSEWTEKRGV